MAKVLCKIQCQVKDKIIVHLKSGIVVNKIIRKITQNADKAILLHKINNSVLLTLNISSILQKSRF